MTKTRFTEEQITDALRRAGSGEAVTEICRKMGVSRQAFYQWRSKFEGMGMMQRRLRQIEEENQKLKRLVADLSLEKDFLRKELSKVVMPLHGNAAIHIVEDSLRETQRGPALV